MFEEIINKVLEAHDDFNYYEIEEMCQDFYDEIPAKIKEETKLKRVNKYITKEFELNSTSNESSDFSNNNSNGEYSLSSIPKYLFQ
jgi:hypothetical protein